MAREHRQETRYQEIGRVIALDLCPISAVLDDISNTGCKIHYSFPIVVDLENEYDIKVSPLHYEELDSLHLICRPQWVNEIEGNTYIGFKVLYSPDAAKLNKFIEYLDEISQDQLPDIE